MEKVRPPWKVSTDSHRVETRLACLLRNFMLLSFSFFDLHPYGRSVRQPPRPMFFKLDCLGCLEVPPDEVHQPCSADSGPATRRPWHASCRGVWASTAAATEASESGSVDGLGTSGSLGSGWQVDSDLTQKWASRRRVSTFQASEC